MSDLISRCELFNQLATIAAPPEANDLKSEIYKVIQSMEEAEPKRGEWILVGNFCGWNRHKCSVCGKDEFRMSNFRPNCGAKMEENP